jgi:hypothetical protein
VGGPIGRGICGTFVCALLVPANANRHAPVMRENKSKPLCRFINAGMVAFSMNLASQKSTGYLLT